MKSLGIVTAATCLVLGAAVGRGVAADSPATLTVKQNGSVLAVEGTDFPDSSTVPVTAVLAGGRGSGTANVDEFGDFELSFAPPAGFSGAITVTAGNVTKTFNFKAGGATSPSPAATNAPKSAVEQPAASAAPAAPVLPAIGTAAKRTSKGNLPSQILDLSIWKVTLPIGEGSGTDCKPTEITQPALAKLTVDPWFHANATGDGVVFRAPVDGCHTANSSYSRSELREMTKSGENAAWSVASGTHTMTVKEAVMTVPVAKPEVTTAQIHGGDDDIMGILVTGKGGGMATVCYRVGDGMGPSCLDDNYKLGTPFEVKIQATNGKISIFYNGALKGSLTSTDDSAYFKVGNYTQSNVSKGDKAGVFGETVVYSVAVTHS